ncbi:MAG: hypothetical protein ACRD52_05830 [Candidatus Acidiferrales bacterium]
MLAFSTVSRHVVPLQVLAARVTGLPPERAETPPGAKNARTLGTRMMNVERAREPSLVMLRQCV